MKELISYRLPPRGETWVTLYADCRVEITQTSAIGKPSPMVRIDEWDLPELIELLEKVRRYELPEPNLAEPAQPSLESLSIAPEKKKGRRSND